jgi:hypothetical protein
MDANRLTVLAYTLAILTVPVLAIAVARLVYANDGDTRRADTSIGGSVRQRRRRNLRHGARADG